MRVYLAPKCVLTLCAVNIVCTLKKVGKRDLLIILSYIRQKQNAASNVACVKSLTTSHLSFTDAINILRRDI